MRGRRVRRREPRFGLIFAVVVVVVAGLVTLQLLRSVPSQTVSLVSLPSVTVPGSSALPWPATGQAAVAIAGASVVRTSGAQQPQPIASLAKMMTALLVLRDHPLTGTSDGPNITITATDVAVYQADVAAEDSVLAVTAGEVLTERQALEGLLLPSADNIAQVLAAWDAGSVPAFVTRMNSEATTLGLQHTTYTDPSGLAASTVSTARDQLVVEQAAMADAAFASIVALPSATFPVGGTQQNYDFDVGHDGIIGVKTGSDSAAQGCWAFAANRTVAGAPHAVYGVVLGIPGTSQGLLEPALSAGLALADALPATVRSVTLLPAGTVVANVEAPWRAAVPVRTTRAITGLALAGQTLKVHVTLAAPKGSTIAAAHVSGEVSSAQVTGTNNSPAATARAGSGPSLWWRLRRL